MDAALRVSKRARTETTISTAGISLARAGIDLAEAHLGGLAASHAVVVGTGALGRLAARLLRDAGVERLSAIAERGFWPRSTPAVPRRSARWLNWSPSPKPNRRCVCRASSPPRTAPR